MTQVALFAASAALTLGSTYLQAKAAKAKGKEVNAVADEIDRMNRKKIEFDKLENAKGIASSNRIRLASIRSTMANQGFDMEGSRAKIITQGSDSQEDSKQSVLDQSAEFANEQSSLTTKYNKAAAKPVDAGYAGLASNLLGGIGMEAVKAGKGIDDIPKLF
tara:strand:+ start:382 stop:867 length:486 start_codon:yes stop_codon:yes gene_type:complete